MYISAPPIISLRDPEHVLNVKLAVFEHILQMALNFFTFSQSGISSRIFGQPFFYHVPLRAERITILPLSAAFSLNSTTSSKNWPSSMPITSKSCQLEISSSFLHEIAYFSTWSWVEMQSTEYLVSEQYFTFKHFLPDISSLLTRRNSSVLLPANIGPIISSIRPRFIFCKDRIYSLSWQISVYFSFILSIISGLIDVICNYVLRKKGI